MRTHHPSVLRPVACGLAALLAGLLAGCATQRPASARLPETGRYTVAVAEIAQETDSFSPVLTGLRDFEAGALYYGADVIAKASPKGTAIGGFVQAIADHGGGEVGVLPILRAAAMSGGPVERAVYEKLKADLLEGLAAAPRLDGIYLVLHGAMGVEGMRDPEGDLLAAVRAQVGPALPIGISHDLHANVTRVRAELATFLVGYHTNPHRDFYRTGYESGRILAGAVRGTLHPVMTVRKMRLLKGGGMNIDFLAPMNRVFRAVSKAEKQKGVLSASVFPVHIWIDDEELGWSTVAVTDGDRALADRIADTLADVAWSIRGVPHPKSYTAEQAVVEAKKRCFARNTGTLVVCDVADAVGAGAPGENTWILKAFLEGAPELATYIPVRDAEVAQALWDTPAGQEVTVSVGGKLETRYNRPLQFTGQVVSRTDGEVGKTVVLRHRGIRLIVSELPAAATKPAFFENLGLDVQAADVVVVKNLFPFRFNFIGVNRGTLDVETPGTTSVDVFGLGYQQVPRPIYPLDPVDSWRAE